jgi:hypothetical protein
VPSYGCSETEREKEERRQKKGNRKERKEKEDRRNEGERKDGRGRRTWAELIFQPDHSRGAPRASQKRQEATRQTNRVRIPSSVSSYTSVSSYYCLASLKGLDNRTYS